ncbi:segregation/condensation protein A [Rubrivirga sp. S365]|uniref:Segregation and condensation protein A n=1 Tax=Rubrivirga litoralis TaxID=3075598 RepID=A0ABU3BTS0_9BACT|nr:MULTISPECIES: segregation/condensation protein A [unclassified Rubrivirga]MDT0632680.1 segregation/condensation protein A [Rubrivirga sp. F394]MDT7857143.1 segregation/condensation protein A [Rubrivirga sp. S365]
MYRVQLDHFEGPLDLLLFFVRRDELDVHDIPVARIADEYLEAVRTLERVDLDAAADFVYTAALLIQIKARMLLPRPELDDDGEPIDPRQELVDRLLEYVRYKEAAGHLEGRFEARRRLFTRGEASAEHDRLAPPPEVAVRATVFDLVKALGAALDRAAAAPPPTHDVERETFAVDVQRAWVLERVGRAGRGANRRGGASFQSLVAGRSKAFVITTFLAVLDLAQRQAIRVVFGLRPEDFALEPAPPADGGGVGETPADAAPPVLADPEP